MPFEIIIHKGHNGFFYNNSLMGIMTALLKKQNCEIDLLFVDNEWKICHDFNTLKKYHTRFSELLDAISKTNIQFENYLILDIKWDFIKNIHDNMKTALSQLSDMIQAFAHFPFFIQASHYTIMNQIIRSGFYSQWKIGMIVSSIHEFNHYKEALNFVMIDMSGFTIEDIIYIHEHENIFVFGYTCPNVSQLTEYHHLYQYLHGIVCDVSV